MDDGSRWPGLVTLATAAVGVLVAVVAALAANSLVRLRRGRNSSANADSQAPSNREANQAWPRQSPASGVTATGLPAAGFPTFGAADRRLGLEAIRAEFFQRREWLEARFLTLAGSSGKPRGLAWIDCEFESQVTWARDRETGDPRALVAVTIRFEAIAGGGMEHNPNVGNLRAATAVFQWTNGQWQTVGRAIFNLSPTQAIQHFQHELEAENC
ncbi:MAG: hypothetical protein U1A77_14920 [Pirellulales bacterium]